MQVPFGKGCVAWVISRTEKNVYILYIYSYVNVLEYASHIVEQEIMYT